MHTVSAHHTVNIVFMEKHLTSQTSTSILLSHVQFNIRRPPTSHTLTHILDHHKPFLSIREQEVSKSGPYKVTNFIHLICKHQPNLNIHTHIQTTRGGSNQIRNAMVSLILSQEIIRRHSSPFGNLVCRNQWMNEGRHDGSTCAAPVIMFGMKSLCPGASIRVTTFEFVSNFVMPTSMVTPLWSTK